jgi:SAM-dependent methyltransferase
MTSSHVRKNRRHWDEDADEYQRLHGATLTRTAMAWGVWRIPEAELNVLGDVRRKDVLELGCGAARWSIALAGLGARPIGLDVSASQLAHAAQGIAASGVSFPLVQASAEELPFADGSFDVVFCDHGATNFTDPGRTVPEVARVLRPGGLFAFSHDSPFHFVCWDPDAQQYGTRLVGDYFDMRSAEDEVSVVFQRPYGEWIRVLRRAGLVVEDLIEPQPPDGGRTTYEEYDDVEWARRWPMEDIWIARKGGDPSPDLVGVSEAAAILGWDRRRVATYVRRGSFPPPVAELAGGRVWDRRDVESFAREFRARQAARARRRRSRPD